MTSRRLPACATALLMAAGCAACTTWQPPHAPPSPHPATAPAMPAPSPDTTALLPLSPASLGAAARTAARFAAAYTTWSGQQPGQWLARLRPLVTAQLARQLTQAAPGSPRESAAGTVTSEKARLLAASMIIIAVQVRQATTGPAGTTTAITSLAITLIPQAGGRWAVYDAEPASAGNTGGIPGAAP